MSEPGTLLELRAVRKSYGDVPILHSIDLDVRDGEFITILGPSGSGKTTILRLIGGFTDLSGGEILLDGRDISSTPINKRPFNTVFQDYALFPHMSVKSNVGYGLAVRGTPRADIESRVKQVMDLVQLGAFSDRFPAQLSGGQRQRVALARAIICRPRLILLDEPLAALDVALRRDMQIFLKSIQTEIQTTFLFVTHDQEEAIAMADRICVMASGRIQQIGSPRAVYDKPSCEFVAKFFGDNNLIPGTLGPRSATVRALETELGRILCAVDGDTDMALAPEGEKALVMCRPEAVGLGESATGENGIPVTVTQVAFGGSSTIVTAAPLRDPSFPLRLRLHNLPAATAPDRGQHITITLPIGSCRLVPA